MSNNFTFDIGENSSTLGTISFDDQSSYSPLPNDGYHGTLPDTQGAWQKMYFSGPNTFIWYNTPINPDFDHKVQVSAEGCFSTDPTPWVQALKWGADITWNSGVPSPTKPTV